MSKISLTPNASGTGTLTIAAPNTSTDRILTLPDETGTVLSSTSNITSQAMNGPTFRASGSGQSISGGVGNKITNATEVWDTASCYDTSTSRFTPNVAGYYQITVILVLPALSSNSLLINYIYKNGSSYSYFYNTVFSGLTHSVTHTDIVYLNGSTDYVEQYGLPGETKSTTTSIITGSLIRAE